jgi:hypothetical protein
MGAGDWGGRGLRVGRGGGRGMDGRGMAREERERQGNVVVEGRRSVLARFGGSGGGSGG